MRESDYRMREYQRREREAQAGIDDAWREFKARETEANYRATVGAYVASFSPEGRMSARYRAKPKGKELLAGEKMAANGHEVEYLAETGEGKHPDALIDGIVSDFKRMESDKNRKVYYRIKDAAKKADSAVIDLALQTIEVADAAEAAGWAIENGIIEKGKVIILDANGTETVV